MKINKIEQNPNFKQIKLSKCDVSEINYLLKYSKKANSDLRYHNAELARIFKPYIEQEAQLIDSSVYSIKDFAQELYLKLVERCTPKLKTYHSPAAYLSEKLNSMKPTEFEKVLLNDKQVEDLTNSEKYYAVQEMTKDSVYETVRKLIKQTPYLTEREIYMLKNYLNGDSFEDIADFMDITKERVRQIIQKCIRKMKMQHNAKYRKKVLELNPNLSAKYPAKIL